MHADPPVEHKAYLHRSGRTARAGATGTVVTLMLDAQVHDVRDLTRKAGIKPTITRIQPGHELLSSIAPGERTYVAEADRPAPAPAGPSGGGRGRGGRGGSGRTAPHGGGGQRRSGGGASSAAGGTGGGGARRGRGGSSSRPAAGGSSRPHSAASFSSRSR